MKKILIILLCIFVVGCSAKKEEKNISGGWDITKLDKISIKEDELKIFNNANEDKELKPIVLLAKQVVSGTNYMFLCQKDNKYKIVVVYNNLENISTIKSITDFDITKYTNENKEINKKESVGSFDVVLNKNIKLDEKTQKIFDEASEKITGTTYYPIAVLGKQTVSGTNYALLAFGTPSTKELVNNTNTGVYILTLYEDLHGTCEIVSSSYIDLSKYNK